MRVFVLLLAAGPLSAQTWFCEFPAVCDAGTACRDTVLFAELRLNTERAEASIMAFDTEFAITPISDQAATFANEQMLLTIAPDGVATLSVHIPPARSYLGRCDISE